MATATAHKTPANGTASEAGTFRVHFPGGAAVHAEHGGFTIRTDQDEAHGGSSSAPQPFDLFLASIATCAGYYALQFLRSRSLPVEGLALTLQPIRHEDGSRVATVRLRVELPEKFPKKYHRALERSIDQCAVKRHILDPPAFEVTLG